MIKERILQLIEFKGFGKEKFFSKVGLTSANFRGKAKETPINSHAIANILSEIPDANLYWLILGEGEMIRNAEKENDNNILFELNERLKECQSLLADSQNQINTLLEILKNRTK